MRTDRSSSLLRIGLALGLAGCGPSPTADPDRGVVLIVSGDTGGWIVPCGCTANQSGGLPRRGTVLGKEREGRDVIYADAGGAPGGTSTYDRVKFEAILDGERAMGLAAHNLGGPEAALGADYLREVSKRTVTRFVSANLRDSRGDLIAPPVRVLTVGGRKIALIGVVSPRLVGKGMKADDPRDAILKAIPDHDALVVLAYMPEAELRALAASLPEADAIVGGPTGQSISPVKIGPTWLASATNKGKFLVRMETSGRRGPWTGRVVEMGPDVADDPAQRTNLAAFHDELARLDLPSDQTGLAAALPPDLPETYRVEGSASCLSCHKEEAQVWSHSKHALGWETLRGTGSQVDPQCQKCHTTGYGLPGGFRSVLRSPERTSIGCESCHGPSREHVQRPSIKTPFASKDQCLSCHDPENSPRFDRDRFWDQIRHGKPSTRTAEHRPEVRP